MFFMQCAMLDTVQRVIFYALGKSIQFKVKTKKNLSFIFPIRTFAWHRPSPAHMCKKRLCFAHIHCLQTYVQKHHLPHQPFHSHVGHVLPLLEAYTISDLQPSRRLCNFSFWGHQKWCLGKGGALRGPLAWWRVAHWETLWGFRPRTLAALQK